MKRIFPIEELRRLVAIALDVSDYEPTESARVRAIPDIRTIRYYTTLGLIDRPAELQGRTAYYNLRHVEQLVAIKRLQTRGLSLADIQQEMLGLSSARLARLANLPDKLETSAREVATENRTASGAEPETAFWKRIPQSAGRRNSRTDSTVEIMRVTRIKLDEHTTLEFNACELPVDTARILAAARPLIDELMRQQLIQVPRSNLKEKNDE